MFIKIKKAGLLLVFAVITALIGMLFYIVTSVTGYLASAAMNPLPVICSLAAIGILALLIMLPEKLTAIIYDLAVAAATVLLIISFVFYVLSRVTLAADVYFIPVNYPQSEAAALHISIVGVAFCLLSVIVMLIAAFSNKYGKE